MPRSRQNDALIAERRQQRFEVALPSGGTGRSVGTAEAESLDRALKDAVDQLRRDFTILFTRYNSFLAELNKLRATEATLRGAG